MFWLEQKEQLIQDQKRTTIQNKITELLTEYAQVEKEVESEADTKLKNQNELLRLQQDIVKLERMIQGLPDLDKTMPELKVRMFVGLYMSS